MSDVISFGFLDVPTHRLLCCGLALSMSDASKEAWFASWLMGLEHLVWDQIQNDDASARSLDLSPVERQLFRSLSLAIKGWVRWTEHLTDDRCLLEEARREDPPTKAPYSGVEFVGIETWLAEHARWLEYRAASASEVTAFQLFQGDAIEVLRRLATGSIDLGITDPAYESLEKHRAIGSTTRLSQSKASSNPWFEIFRNERFPELLAEYYRVLKRDAHLYVYCDLETAKVIDPMGVAAGFTSWNWITWDKRRLGMGWHYRHRKEFIIFFEKGYRKLASQSVPDVLDDMADDLAGVDTICELRVDGGYPTEKPVKVSNVLIEQSSLPGEIVLDVFMGSGSVGEAAISSGRRFVGGDLSERSLKLAHPRLCGVGGRETEIVGAHQRGPTADLFGGALVAPARKT